MGVAEDAKLGRMVWFGVTTWNLNRATQNFADNPYSPAAAHDVGTAAALWGFSGVSLFIPDPEMTALGWTFRTVPKATWRAAVFTAKSSFKYGVKPLVTFASRQALKLVKSPTFYATLSVAVMTKMWAREVAKMRVQEKIALLGGGGQQPGSPTQPLYKPTPVPGVTP